ncbi:polysaccharide lyase family 7 protein [Nonomuraea guangzhouensis]|uniref:Polysaccharide lyase family 7 protein n=1 Tax=Nonomuraea guangzhouensis TaxID=1291555 RepID=A0ABW4GKR2_9ACTN|nr:polysaccharide lyase family 7 protein [Nonomuraea guangzhouensis]
MRRRTFIAGTGALGLTAWGWPSAAYAAPIGSGWTEVSPGYTVHQPPDLTRHTYDAATGEHHFWLYSSDPSTFPGQDSGPRSELRFRNDYTSGSAQFECDIKVASGAHNVCVMQVFGGSSWATAFMTLAMNTNSINYYDQARIYGPIYDTYLRLNVVHETGPGLVHVFVNRQFRATFQDHGAATHYFKCGLYGRAGMASRNDAYIKNVHLYKKS